MSAMDDAMAKLAAAVTASNEAAAMKAVDDYRAANPQVDPAVVASQQEQTDANVVEAFATQITPG